MQTTGNTKPLGWPLSAAWLLLALLAWQPLAGLACDTPVYRFAMYSHRWHPHPYVVVCLHPGKVDEPAAAVNERVKKLAQDDRQLTNVALEVVDASDAEALQQVPAVVRKVWQAQKDKSRAMHAVFNPRGQQVFAGELKPADVPLLIDSQLRQQMAKLLGGGKIVMLIWQGKDEKENARAEKVVAEVVQTAKSGKLAANRGPESLLPPVEGAEKKDAEPQKDGAPKKPADKPDKIDVATIKLSPADKQEQWLVRMLLRTDSDLDEFVDKTMVFAIYGRGRSMPPYIGKGITAENLIYNEGLVFLSGPCSCEIKEQNPGTDLLTTHDWEAAAAKMARIFGEEEGNEGLLDPALLVPTLNLSKDDPATSPPGQPPTEPAPPRSEGNGNERKSKNGEESSAPVPSTSVNNTEPSAARSTKNAAAPTSTTPGVVLPDADAASTSRPRFSGTMAMYLGVGLGAVFVFLVIGSLVFFHGGRG